MSDINKATRDYLCAYIDRPDPGFAVMLKAPWGAGKTHLIKEIINEIEGKKPLYVSLFGVGSMEEVEQAIFMASLPMLGTDWAKAVGRVGKMALKFIPVDFKGIKPEDFLKLELPQTLIFDDLERTRMAPREILGTINGFVEHQGRNVIVLANEKKLWGKKNRKEKEKVIGRTLTVVADIDAALDALFEKLGKNVKGFLSESRGIVVEIFEQAGYENLRTLEQALWEFERVYNVLEERFLKKTEGMVALLRLFLALTLEVKAGTLGLADLKLRGDIEYNNKSKFENLRKTGQKYGNEEIKYGRYGSVISTEFAIALIWDGAINSGKINSTLAQHNLFIEPQDEVEWQTVWWVWHREAAVVEAAFVEMTKKFEAREYLEPEALLQVFSVWLNTFEIGLSNKKIDTLEAECQVYIADIEAAKTLPATKPDSHSYNRENSATYGLGFPHRDTARGDAFWRLHDEMYAAQDRLLLGSYEEYCSKLLGWMETDPDRFSTVLSDTGRDGVYGFRPVLAAMDKDKFVSKLVDPSIKNQESVFKTLKYRYQKPSQELVDERRWLSGVVELLDAHAKALKGVKKHQLESKMEFNLRPIIDGWISDN
ncbi:MAG: KAP family NTPase [Rhodobacteraceae bacterium]|nr:KAP family NTPase [Paracoccaceae bacterium]